MRLVAKRRDDGILLAEALAEEGAVVFANACEMGSKDRVVSIASGEAATG
jgi:hypothetical protein